MNESMKNITILLTGCIQPNTKDVLVVSNAEIRKRQYLNAIEWNLEHTPYRIVFCENSGTDISGEVNDPNHRVEFLTYMSSPMKNDYGKGFRELEILEYAAQHSEYLMKSDVIIKGTGRLILKNIVPIASWLSKKRQSNFCASWMSIKKVHSDCRFFFCSPSFLRIIIGCKSRIKSNFYFEKLLAECIGKNRERFIYPYIWFDVEGVGGAKV